MEQELLTQIEDLFGQAKTMNEQFARETYAVAFKGYCEKNHSLWQNMADACSKDLESGENKACQEIGEAFVKTVQKRLEQESKKKKQDSVQLDLNLYMVSYVLPAILEYYKDYVGPMKQAELLTGAICEKWSALPKGGHIEAADYATIQGGFKSKLCFVTTAVCTGLQKPQDCEEILLMKKYRDEYLADEEGGAALIEEYYDVAPTIVKRISRSNEADATYHYLWEHYISKCVEQIKQGRLEESRDTYVEMMQELKAAYFITNTH